MRHLHPDNDALANQILFALLKASSRKNEPVKLSEISDVVYGSTDKDKQDILRLTIEKTLIRCGIVDKIYFAERDVRYFPVAYRFQEVRRIETGTGSKIEQVVGEVVELPKDGWPVPREYFELLTSKAGCEDALRKLEEDSKRALVTPSASQQVKAKLQKELDGISKKLKEYEAITEIM
jgi:hypothetical protein